MTAGRLTQITGRGYTDSAPEKDGDRIGVLNLKADNRHQRGFFMSVCLLLWADCTGCSNARRDLESGTPTCTALPTPIGVEVASGKTISRRHNMSNQSIATSVAPTVPQLRDAIESMDSLSESGFSEIASIAKMALAYLETPNVALHVEDIANALSAIQGKAEDIKNCINYQAEEVGCNYVDEAKIRRLNVWFKGA